MVLVFESAEETSYTNNNWNVGSDSYTTHVENNNGADLTRAFHLMTST